MKKQYGKTGKAASGAGWWKHLRDFKRAANKSTRKEAKKELKGS